LKGHVTVLHKDKTSRLEKGQSLSINAGDESSLNVGRLADEDDFDHWVSGRIDAVSTATNAALQYTNSPYYTSGFADLFTYGAFSSCGGYGLAGDLLALDWAGRILDRSMDVDPVRLTWMSSQAWAGSVSLRRLAV